MWLRLSFNAFMTVLVLVYWVNYGPSNFVCFCDAALFLTPFAIWTDKALPVSMAAAGILVPQFFRCVDFGAELLGFPLTGMTSYMFHENRSLFLRGLSLFHGWLPFLLVYFVFRLGYDRRALLAWTGLAVVLCLPGFLACDRLVKVHRERQNLDRCRTHAKLLGSIRQQGTQMKKLIDAR